MNTNTATKETNMDAPSFITDIAQARVDAILSTPDDPYYTAAYTRRDELDKQLTERGTSAVAREELRLLTEVCYDIDAEHEAEAKAEMAAENAWLTHAELPTADDYAFERYEAEMGLV